VYIVLVGLVRSDFDTQQDIYIERERDNVREVSSRDSLSLALSHSLSPPLSLSLSLFLSFSLSLSQVSEYCIPLLSQFVAIISASSTD